MPLIADGTTVGKYTVRRCVTDKVPLGAVYEVEFTDGGTTVVGPVNLLAPGTVVANGRTAYTVTRFLGGGGFGQAYLADHDGRELVVKRYTGGDDPEDSRNALLREGRAMADFGSSLKALTYDGLPEVVDYFAVDAENAVVVMTRVPGRPLDEWVADARRADPDFWKAPKHTGLVLNWALSLAELLGVLHNLSPNGLAHLDVKPENVLVRDDGKVSLIDFGAARVLGPRGPQYDPNKTLIALSAGFAAPEYEREAAAGRVPAPTPGCDVYSAGVLMRVMLTGDDPRDAPAAAALAPLPPTGVPLWDRLAAVAAKAHEFLPDARYRSAADLTAALLDLTDDPARGRPDGLCRHCRRLTRRAATFCAHCGLPAWAELPPAPAAAVPIGRGPADDTRAVEILTRVGQNRPADLAQFRLFQRLQAAEQDTGFAELKCLDLVKADKLDHQIDAARTVLRKMGGFALLADEVGLGKTIEAGIVLKELVVRDLAQRVLVVVPEHILDQWQQELYQRFGEYFVRFGRDVDTTLAWQCSRLLVPYRVAEDRTQWAAAGAREYDLVIFDEAHHLLDHDAQRGEKLQKFARRLGQKARRLLMLSATPMLSELRDLHTLLTLLKPGSDGDLKQFLDRYQDRSGPGKVLHPEELQERVRSVMIRNTRQRVPRMRFLTREVYRQPVAADGEDARRFARFRGFITRLCRRPDDPDDDQGRAFYAAARDLAGAYHSSPAAFAARCDEVLGGFRPELERAAARARLPDAVATLTDFRTDHHERLVAGKVRAVCDTLNRRRKYGGKFLVFTQYHETARFLRDHLAAGTGLAVARYPAPEEDEDGVLGHTALTAFGKATDVLVCGPNATEGLNLQVAHSLINYDLPPDPMKLEQRIGRIQRYGQRQRKVFVWNLYLRDTYEQVLLDGLEDMLTAITDAVGEHEQILGNLVRHARAEGQDFTDLFFDMILAGDGDGPPADDRMARLLALGEQEQTVGASLLGALFPDAPAPDAAAAAAAEFDPQLPSDTLELLGARVRRAAAGTDRCPVCAGPVGPGDPACPACGQPLRGGPDEPDGADDPGGPVAAVADVGGDDGGFPPCPHCGAAQTAPVPCCGTCGEELAPPPAAVPAALPPCPHCGAARENPTPCCGVCGEELAV